MWININYLTIRALDSYAERLKQVGNTEQADFMSQTSKVLRRRIIRNVFDQFMKRGFMYENYNDKDG